TSDVLRGSARLSSGDRGTHHPSRRRFVRRLPCDSTRIVPPLASLERAYHGPSHPGDAMPLFRPHCRRAGLLLAPLLMTGIAPADAATLIVTTTEDSCRAWILGGRCLRSAIEYANLIEDADRIFFDIPGNPDHYKR